MRAKFWPRALDQTGRFLPFLLGQWAAPIYALDLVWAGADSAIPLVGQYLATLALRGNQNGSLCEFAALPEAAFATLAL